VRIHRHDRAILPFDRLLRRNLQIEIQGQLELLAGLRRRFVQPADFAPMAIHERAPRSVLAHQDVVVLLLDSAHTDHVAGVVEFELRLVEHVFRHFADVADQVRHETVARIQPPVRHDGFKFGKLVLVRLDERQFVGRDVFLQENRLVLRHRGEAPDALPHFLGIQMQPLRNGVRVRVQIARRIAQQERGKRRIVIDNDAAFAIQDFAPRRQNRHIANAVLLRQQCVLIAVHHLQPPQSVGQKQKNEQHDILHGGQAERGNLFFAAEHQSSVPAILSSQHGKAPSLNRNRRLR
jgi:hypothetical protein